MFVCTTKISFVMYNNFYVFSFNICLLYIFIWFWLISSSWYFSSLPSCVACVVIDWNRCIRWCDKFFTTRLAMHKALCKAIRHNSWHPAYFQTGSICLRQTCSVACWGFYVYLQQNQVSTIISRVSWILAKTIFPQDHVQDPPNELHFANDPGDWLFQRDEAKHP